MAGLYIHIPFCGRRCLYCDFFSQTDMRLKQDFIGALLREMELRRDYLGRDSVETIYFGGGTPSLLDIDDFGRIFEAVGRLFGTDRCGEITLEANPDDLTPGYISALRTLPFNRISIGVQSFHEKDLLFLNRRHTRGQAIRAVGQCRDAGFRNISIDLIYGLPGQTLTEWETGLDEALRLEVPHISAYHLTYEAGTPLQKLLEAGKVKPADEEQSLSFFSALIDKLTAAGYRQYEISNFARPGYHSRHNSAYWSGAKYIGLGPSAHSYDGKSRQWNVSSLPDYIRGARTGSLSFEMETLDRDTRYNDFIITRLRTAAGIRLDEVRSLFGDEVLAYLECQAAPYLRRGLLDERNHTLVLSRKGLFLSDGIMSGLLRV